ncbi:glycosyltransferase [Nostoc sp. FACHB-87]|uniref:glycosyltransferase n=1 Tax=Nostocaceae TaxID=1162 RepID=UPI00168859FD|nr:MULTISPECIES: glycosyltransferase [Nostocaceae]MBD2456559.1 glycosyltransferase [Nostoc sp. FACHB-87]MBD2477210.1 glycosyltransferase [Anabaena sp. FACHB-83]
MKKIAIYYPYFMGGGAEAVGLWIIQALKDKYDLTLFTLGKVEIERLNLMYGTSILNEDIKIKYLLPDLITNFCYFMMANSKNIRMAFFHLLIRFFKQHSQEYDLVLSGYNAVDMGQVGIQYIHWVKVLEGTHFHRKISNFSEAQISQNLSIANSYCVADVVKKTYGIDAKVVYPPVVIDVPNLPWHEKEDAFICSGRIVKAKEPHRVIKILKLVREQGFDIKLHITGGGGGIYEWQYTNLIKNLVSENSSWITVHENLPYKEYIQVLARCKYGIHFKKEPFGISIAEMVKAGAIPFVRGDGGQVEIVGQHNQELFFNTEAEAVEKIIDVLKISEQQNKLIQSLTNQKNLFSTHRFMSEINETVTEYLDQKIELPIMI